MFMLALIIISTKPGGYQQNFSPSQCLAYVTLDSLCSLNYLALGWNNFTVKLHNAATMRNLGALYRGL